MRVPDSRFQEGFWERTVPGPRLRMRNKLTKRNKGISLQPGLIRHVQHPGAFFLAFSPLWSYRAVVVTEAWAGQPGYYGYVRTGIQQTAHKGASQVMGREGLDDLKLWD